MKNKNPHLHRHIEITETQQQLRNSRLSPEKKKSLNSKIGGLKKGLPTKNTLKGC
jgi:hypothetical protein